MLGNRWRDQKYDISFNLKYPWKASRKSLVNRYIYCAAANFPDPSQTDRLQSFAEDTHKGGRCRRRWMKDEQTPHSSDVLLRIVSACVLFSEYMYICMTRTICAAPRARACDSGSIEKAAAAVAGSCGWPRGPDWMDVMCVGARLSAHT